MARPRKQVSSDGAGGGSPASEPKALHHDAQMMLDEARMVLPRHSGPVRISADCRVQRRLRPTREYRTARTPGSIFLVTISIALIMTPAAYDRIVNDPTISRGFIRLASRVITSAMVPLMLGIAIDIYVVTSVVIDARLAAIGAAFFVALLFVALWFAFPWSRRTRPLR